MSHRSAESVSLQETFETTSGLVDQYLERFLRVRGRVDFGDAELAVIVAEVLLDQVRDREDLAGLGAVLLVWLANLQGVSGAAKE